MIMKTFILLTWLCSTIHVEYLGDRSYRRREAAHTSLNRMGEWAVQAINRGVFHSDPEISSRCQLLLNQQWTPLDECKQWLKRKDIPWVFLDGSYNSSASRRFLQRAYDCYRPDPSGGIYSQWRDATRIWLHERLAEGAPPLWILQQIDAMRQAECNHNFGR